MPTDITGFYLGQEAQVFGAAMRGTTKSLAPATVIKRAMTYQFSPHFHPYVRELVDELIARGIDGLLAKDTEYVQTDEAGNVTLLTAPAAGAKPTLFDDAAFLAEYAPAAMVGTPYPTKELDFSTGSAYGVYNWEVFFHIPLTIAINLSRNQRFEEAQRWFHFIFDPTDDSLGATPERFWKVKPFQTTDVDLIEEILTNLATGEDEQLRQDTVNSIGAWKDSPFRPHVIARYRPTAYMLKTVMAYLDNLITWGDSLFRQDTGESIGEATQLYVTAANLLGPRPQLVPKQGSLTTQTYHSLRANRNEAGLDEFSNAMREMETALPFDLAPTPTRVGDSDRMSPLRSVGGDLYFCIPRNDTLIAYWDTVADRLFKIRNSLNLQGVFRQLPLFEPPIDPALLARAAAAGLDIAAVVASANQPLPLVRFQTLAQRATELCAEVKTLGGGLLAALEKEDNEALTILRAKHERIILELAEAVRYGQWQEAIKNQEATSHAIANATHRYAYYERLLGRPENEITLPELEKLDVEGLLKLKFRAGEPEVTLRTLPVEIAQNLGSEAGGKQLSTEELTELKKLKDARDKQASAAAKDKIGAGLSAIPDIGINLHYWGLGGHLVTIASKAMPFWASFDRSAADELTYLATNTAKLGSYGRRELEWAFQSNLAAGEITHLFKQLRAAEIRVALAERELRNHQRQISHAQEIELFLTDEKKGKHANQALYAWMKREVRGLYSQCFQFAFDVAKKAERALQFELGDPGLSFLQFGYTAGKEGLLAGEKLYFDLKRMEMAYHDLNQREHELTKHISLLQLNPEALLQLRQSGRCTVSVPESLFDLGGAGHYFRRLKSVAVTIPCVVGPYTAVNCTLTLLRSSVRATPRLLEDGAYARVDANDDRFQERTGSIQSIVTSSGQNDSGLFEVNLRDERYLPFEGAGAVSEWQLALPHPIHQFDYDTISDVILHLRYTARNGGDALAAAATTHLSALIGRTEAVGTTRLFSVREEFPSEWAKFQRLDAASVATITLPLRPEHYPFWSQGRLDAVRRIDVYSRSETGATVTLGADGPETMLDDGDSSLNGLWVGMFSDELDQSPIADLTLSFSDNSMTDLWLAITWSGTGPA